MAWAVGSSPSNREMEGHIGRRGGARPQDGLYLFPSSHILYEGRLDWQVGMYIGAFVVG